MSRPGKVPTFDIRAFCENFEGKDISLVVSKIQLLGESAFFEVLRSFSQARKYQFMLLLREIVVVMGKIYPNKQSFVVGRISVDVFEATTRAGITFGRIDIMFGSKIASMTYKLGENVISFNAKNSRCGKVVDEVMEEEFVGIFQ